MSEYQEDAFLQDILTELSIKEGQEENMGQVLAEEDVDKESQLLGEKLLQPIYQAGHAKTQEEYEAAYDRVFESLDQLEERLQTKDYLVGDQVSAADVRLYSVLVRFNIIYYF